MARGKAAMRLAGISSVAYADLLVRMVPLCTWIVENADRFREARQNFDRRHRDVET